MNWVPLNQRMAHGIWRGKRIGNARATSVARTKTSLARWVMRRLVPAGCLMGLLTFGSATSAQGIPAPLAPSRSLLLPSPIPSLSSSVPTLPSPVPSPSLPTLQSPAPSLLPSPPTPEVPQGLGNTDPAVPQSSQSPLSPPGASGGADPADRPMAPSKSSGQGSAPSRQTDRAGSSQVCPILGLGGGGCPGLPPSIIQQLAETGYGGILALIAGAILVLAGVGGLILRRRRRHLLT